MIRGTIVKALSGYYYVKTGNEVFQCRARGIFKKQGITPLVGDEVEIEILDEEDGVIDDILPRKNEFIRPPISNIDNFVIMISISDPEPNLEIVDRFLVSAEMARVDSIICLNKMDMTGLTDFDGADKISDEADRIKKVYTGIYPLCCISAQDGEGVEDLNKMISGKRVAFAGPSGVGKTTLLNLLGKDIEENTDSVSRKTGRGKHTTRHVEMYDAGGAIIYDTPGFTSFSAAGIEKMDLADCFPEMREAKCRYDNCRHIAEPGCAVKEAVRNGSINKSRYDSYKKMYEELSEGKK